MDQSAKETVIIVHGTWAAPVPAKSQWYQRLVGDSAAEGFVAKLDDELEKRGSAARCWSHCSNGNQLFHWSGENSWIDRTRAASALGAYVAKLQIEGWRCHIVAHSHGGNVVVEALPEITPAARSNGFLGKIVTLGTPFMNAIAPILSNARAVRGIQDALAWIGFVAVMIVVALAIINSSPSRHKGFVEVLRYWYDDVAVVGFILLIALLFYKEKVRGIGGFLKASFWMVLVTIASILGLRIVSLWRVMGRAEFFSYWSDDIAFAAFIVLAWAALYRLAVRLSRIAVPTVNEGGQIPLQFLAIGSAMDEAWQILHHMGNIDNPLAVRSGLLAYLGRSARDHISLRAQIDRIHGAKSYKNLGIIARCCLAIVHLYCAWFLIGWIVLLLSHNADSEQVIADQVAIFGRVDYAVAAEFAIILVVVLFLTRVLGDEFYSAFWSPFRWGLHGLNSIKNIFTDSATYYVRRKGWSVLLEIVMGLEGYRGQLPHIQQHPSWLPKNLVKYEDVPSGALQRALAKRRAWIDRHLGAVADTFANMAVSAADIADLLRTIEADQSLVHAAYYTDDECISRIADWIAGKG